MPQPANDLPLALVVNAGSGRHDTDALSRALGDALRAASRRHRVHLVRDPKQLQSTIEAAADEARAHDGAVVAVGGDGTQNAVAAAAYARDIPLGVLPLGTFNYFGREHGIAPGLDGALEALLHAPVRHVQAGLVNDRLFLVNASLGMYPELLQDREGWKQRLGRRRLVAFWSGLHTLLRHHPSLRLDLDDGRERRAARTQTLVVSNNALQLERLGIAEAARVQANQGELVAIGLQPIGKPALLGLMLRGALGTLGNADRVVTLPFRSLNVDRRGGGRRAKVAIDGEILWLDYPLRFSTTPRPLKLLALGGRQPGEDPG